MNAFELIDDSKNISNAIEALEWVQKSVPMLRKQAEEIEYWKDAFGKAMALTEHMKHLEHQVYGGTTK